MNPTTTGILAAAALIVAFAAGTMIEFEDGSIEISSPVETEGPMEKIGETLDEAANQ